MGLAALLAWLMLAPDAVAATASEHANLEVMIRQLNALEDTARRSARVAEEPGQRYFFDYQRLASDIQRVRHGLQNYLTPSRAQPRDPAELSGNYTLTGGRLP
ncbi:RAQPRD family integrative conjugative element protein [Pseudomonas lalucatii]|nr:RAQPRD family integrative conjugative element protein [Pseudomonas lalucatii]